MMVLFKMLLPCWPLERHLSYAKSLIAFDCNICREEACLAEGSGRAAGSLLSLGKVKGESRSSVGIYSAGLASSGDRIGSNGNG